MRHELGGEFVGKYNVETLWCNPYFGVGVGGSQQRKFRYLKIQKMLACCAISAKISHFFYGAKSVFFVDLATPPPPDALIDLLIILLNHRFLKY